MAANSQFAVTLHTAAVLAHHGRRFVPSKEIAKSVNTHSVVIRRTLQKLIRAKLVETAAGSIGGARLSRPADQITLLDIYRAVEGPGIFAVHTNPANQGCVISSNIKEELSSLFGRAEDAVSAIFGMVTLASFLQNFPFPRQ